MLAKADGIFGNFDIGGGVVDAVIVTKLAKMANLRAEGFDEKKDRPEMIDRDCTAD